MMIYTLTMNPCLDLAIKVDDLILAKLNVASKAVTHPGGKGINVSLVLKHLGVDNVALGFLGGKTGATILSEVQKEGIRPDFVIIKEENRVNIKVRQNDGTTTEINSQGPIVTSSELIEIYRKLDQIDDGDYLVMSGSVPPSIPHTIYAEIMQYISFKKIRVVVDSRKDLLKNTLPYHPFLIKPNLLELAEIFGFELDEHGRMNEENIRDCLNELIDMGAENVLLSLGVDGAVFFSHKRELYYQPAPKGPVESTVGAGDSLIAGFLASYGENEDIVAALRLGVACGSATSFTEWLATGNDIKKVLQLF